MLKRNVFQWIRMSIVSVAFAVMTATAQAPPDVRVALVIGNADYAGGAKLVNSANDARAMADTLKQLGFLVIELRDGGKKEMTEAIAKVRETLHGKQGVGMLYYAGHGLQLDWRNYMVPIDARLVRAADVAEQTVDVSQVIDAFKNAGNRMNILVLDACRDNPFATTASGKGLAQIDAPPGTFLAYATAPGNVAEDGDAKGGNGLYTQYLLEELKKPAARIEDVFKRVRLNVRRQSQGRQIPWESTSLEDDFYFNRGVAVQAAKPDAKAKEVAFVAEKLDWDKIKDGKSANDFYAFLQKYPNGFLNEQAQSKLDQLQKALTVAVANVDGLTDLRNDRFQVGDTFVYSEKDALTGVFQRTLQSRVTSIEGDVVKINLGGMILNRLGGLLEFRPQGRAVTYDPPYANGPAEFKLGHRWEGFSEYDWIDGIHYRARYTGKVAAIETIAIPAGSFKTFRVEIQVFYQNRASEQWTLWFDPRYGLPLKRQILGKTDSGYYRTELLEATSIRTDRSS